jgi:hypothetical protein
MIELKLTQQKEVIKWVIESGMDIQYGKLSLCDLRNYRYGNVRSDRRYQVHSDDRNWEFSGIYDELEPAIEKFLYLKPRCRRMH